MTSLLRRLRSAGLALLVAFATAFGLIGSGALASEIKYVVNDTAITSYDVQRRAAFLKLQNRKGANAKLAADEMIDQALKDGEIKRLGIRIGDAQVDDAYARFASSNKLSTKQLDGILEQAGVTRGHFKNYIRTQMGWNQAISARAKATQGGTPEQKAVREMLKQGGAKPTATEYMLQHVIFVVPAGERKATLGKRKKEAEAMRGRFSGCDSTRQFAKGLIDVTVRDLGRILAPELPGEWAEPVKAAGAGNATPVRETERGVEFIGVCSAKEVSDDRVAQLTIQGNGKGGDEKAEEASTKYLAELKEKARIVAR